MGTTALTRMTRQRAVILEELRKVTSHPTVDELHRLVRERLPRISLGTVYRNLDFLVQTGQVLCLEAGGATRRFDGNVTPHQHVRCVVCGRVANVFPSHPAPDTTGMAVPGFSRILQARIEFDGVCEECAAKMQEQAAARDDVPMTGTQA